MTLEKVVTHDCQVLEDGQIQARTITRIMEDGVELSKSYHRKVIDVGADVTNETDMWKSVAQAVHTPARIAARVAFIAAQEERDNPAPVELPEVV
jgi:hypothetical protein